MNTQIQASTASSANCFFLNGKIEEGFVINFDHPLSGGRAALILGERSFVLRNKYNGCVYEGRVGGQAVVRRAELDEIQIEGDRTFPILSKAGNTAKKLVHVDFGMAPGAKTAVGLEPLWAGVGGFGTKGRIVSRDNTGALVEMDKDDTLFVFYQSGEVVRVSYSDFGTKNVIFRLAPEDALDVRIDLVRDWLKTAAAEKAELSRGKNHDRALHEFAAMLRMSKLFPNLGKKIVHAVDSLAANGCVFRSGVQQHFKEVLAALNDRMIYSWLADETAGEEEEQVSGKEPPRKCDGRLHSLISDAMNKAGSWEVACNAIVVAAEQDNLRPGVQKRFILECPADKSALSNQVGKLPLAAAQQTCIASSPLGRGDKPLSAQEKIVAEKARAEKRAERHAAQPSRGANNGGGKKKGSDKK